MISILPVPKTLNTVQAKFSAYLNVVRFLAAFAVCIGHSSGVNWTGGLLWQVGSYADTSS
jgi:hypothetical protein